MTEDNNVQIGTAALATLAVETWRAWKELAANPDLPGAVGVRYALRKIRAVLEEHDLSYLDSTGTTYDPGMALDVVDIDGDDRGEGVLVIKETLAPAILLHGQVIAWGQVVLERRGA